MAIADDLTHLARHDAPRVLSVIATQFRDLDLADDAVQDALVDAARSWPETGVPDNPGGWLMSVARRRAIDATRRAKRQKDRLPAVGYQLEEQRQPADERGDPMIDDNNARSNAADVGDERLRLMLLCCHPALDRDAQVALTLRLVAGLTVSEIAAAFLSAETTIGQRIVRAKRKIRMANMPLSMPDRLDDRIDVVLRVLYLVFNEGYLAHTDSSNPIRLELVDEAVRLTELVVELVPESAEALGLCALERFHRARSAGRFDRHGHLVVLDEQDRTGWDLGEIGQANVCIGRAMERMHPGPFQVEAMIAAHHANARTAADTDWPSIVLLFDQLLAMTGSAIVALNRAVAVAMADGPLAGLNALDGVDGLETYHLYWATRGELLRRSGDPERAQTALQRALDLDLHPAERDHVERRLLDVGEDRSDTLPT